MKGISWFSFLGYTQSEAVALHSSDACVPPRPGNLDSRAWDPFHPITDAEDLIVQAETASVGFLCSC